MGKEIEVTITGQVHDFERAIEYIRALHDGEELEVEEKEFLTSFVDSFEAAVQKAS